MGFTLGNLSTFLIEIGKCNYGKHPFKMYYVVN